MVIGHFHRKSGVCFNLLSVQCPGETAGQELTSSIVIIRDKEFGRNTVDFSFQILKDTNPTAEQLADNAYLTNDDNWETVASYTGNTSNTTVITFDEPVVGRYFRLDVTKGDNSAHASKESHHWLFKCPSFPSSSFS